MNLRGIDFGRIEMASGTNGFKCDGTEYYLHEITKPDFTGFTKVPKTATLNARNTSNGANMDIDEKLRPIERFPKCIFINPFIPCAVNAVGLTNPGLEALLNMNIWQKWIISFFLSLMAVSTDEKEWINEWKQMTKILKARKHEFNASFGVQYNLSCPNTQNDPKALFKKIKTVLDIALDLDVPTVFKFSVSQVTATDMMLIENHPALDAILISNTIPWKDLPLWVRLSSFGTPVSPLRFRGIKQDGGYSGPYIFGLVEKMIKELRSKGFKKGVIACGGITKPIHIIKMCEAGADAVAVGLGGTARWYRLPELVKTANTLKWRE